MEEPGDEGAEDEVGGEDAVAPPDVRGLGDGLPEESGRDQFAEGPQVLEIGDAEGRISHGCRVVGGRL